MTTTTSRLGSIQKVLLVAILAILTTTAVGRETDFLTGVYQRASMINSRPMPVYTKNRLGQADEEEAEEGEEEEEEEIVLKCSERPDCDPYFEGRKFFRAFDQGFQGHIYARNFSNCAYNSLTWVFKDIATYKVKLHYGDYQDKITNTTLFLQNTTDLLHVCTDVVENIYYYALFQAAKFNSFVDWTLAFLQNLLGSAIRLTSISQLMVKLDKQNQKEELLFYIGTIIRMLFVFEPIEYDLERRLMSPHNFESGLELEHERIPLQKKKKTNRADDAFEDAQDKLEPTFAPKPEEIEGKQADQKDEIKTIIIDGEGTITVDGEVIIQDPEQASHADDDHHDDDVLTGLEAFSHPRGLMEFTIGFMNGTSLIVDQEDMMTCGNAIIVDMIEGGIQFYNETTSGSVFVGLYYMYDMIKALHPTVFYCRKTIMDAYRGAGVHFDNLDDVRRIIDNFVHNFSFMVDVVLDLSSFFNDSDRGQAMEGPYDAGYGIGMLVFYLIADEQTVLMADPAEGAIVPLKFEWGVNIKRWKEEDRIRKEEKERKRAEEIAAAEAAALLEEEGENDPDF